MTVSAPLRLGIHHAKEHWRKVPMARWKRPSSHGLWICGQKISPWAEICSNEKLTCSRACWVMTSSRQVPAGCRAPKNREAPLGKCSTVKRAAQTWLQSKVVRQKTYPIFWENTLPATSATPTVACLPDAAWKMLTLKGQRCQCGKHSKQRLTILLCINMDSPDKWDPLIIGKTAKPQYF